MLKIVKNNFYSDPKPLIEKFLCVVTITGSNAFEASMINNLSIAMRNSLHNVISRIKTASSYYELELLFRQIDNNKNSYDNRKDCEAYFKTAEDLGASLELNYLTKLCEKKIELLSLSKDEENQFKYQLKRIKRILRESCRIL